MVLEVFKSALVGGAVGATCLVAAPLVLTGIGFTAAGISAGSYATAMMSAAAVANGGGVAAGSTVAILQSVSMGGIALGTKVAAVAASAAAGAIMSKAK